MLKTLKRLNKKLRLWVKLILVALPVIALVILFFSLNGPPDQTPKVTPNEAKTQAAVPYRPEDFVRDEKGFMTCLSGAYATGIDVSEHQKSVDWEKVKDAGISFVFIRIGGRGTTEGGLYADSMTKSHYEGAKQAGLQVGMYFYAQAITIEEAREEAAFVLEQLSGYDLDLPLVYDWEWGGKDSRTDNMEKAFLTQITEAFCQDISAAGYAPMIYFNESQGLEQLDLERLSAYPFWLAMYDGPMDFPYAVDCWQYSATGSVEGIDGDVDLNIRLLN